MVVVIGPSNTMQHSRLSAPPDATLSGMRTSYLGNLQLLRHIFGPELFMHGLRMRLGNRMPLDDAHDAVGEDAGAACMLLLIACR